MQKATVALLLAIAALSLVATVEGEFYFTADDLKSDESLWELYGRWAAHHGVVRERGRFPAFKDNAQKPRQAGDLMPLNVFGDSSFDEFAATSCCLEELETEVIDKVDWREHYLSLKDYSDRMAVGHERTATTATSGSPAPGTMGIAGSSSSPTPGRSAGRSRPAANLVS